MSKHSNSKHSNGERSHAKRSESKRSDAEIELEKLQLKDMFDPVFDKFRIVCRTRQQIEYADKIYTNFENIASSQLSLDKKEKFVHRLMIALLTKIINFKKTGTYTLNGGKSRRQKKGGKSRRNQTQRRF